MSETSSERPIATDEAAAAGITENPPTNTRPARDQPELPLDADGKDKEPAAKPEAAPEADEKPEAGAPPVKPPVPWFAKKLREKDEQLARQAAELEALRAGQQPLDDATLNARAQMLADHRAFMAACDRVLAEGTKEFGPEFVAARDTLTNAFGEELRQRPEFIQAITELDHGHRVYYALAADLDTAAEILALPPHKAALRLAKLEATLTAKPAPARASKVAAPISPVSGTASPPEDIYDPGLSMADFDRIMRKQESERRRGR